MTQICARLTMQTSPFHVNTPLSPSCVPQHIGEFEYDYEVREQDVFCCIELGDSRRRCLSLYGENFKFSSVHCQL